VPGRRWAAYLSTPTIDGERSRHKRESGNGAMRSPQAGPETFWKKRGSIRRWSLERSGRSQIQSNGKWTREEDTPFAGWASVEGGGYDVSPVVADRDRGRRVRPDHIDNRNMDFDRLVINAPSDMSAMHSAQTRSGVLSQDHGRVIARGRYRRKGMAPRLGKLRGQVASGQAACRADDGAREEGYAAVCRLAM